MNNNLKGNYLFRLLPCNPRLQPSKIYWCCNSRIILVRTMQGTGVIRLKQR